MTTLNFEKDFASKYFCAFHKVKLLGYVPARNRTNAIKKQRIESLYVYKLVSPILIHQPRCNPLYYMVVDKIIRHSSESGYSDLDQTIAEMFGVNTSLIDVLSNIIQGDTIHKTSFNAQLGYYFKHHLYKEANSWYDVDYLSKLCPKFDFTNHKIKTNT